jgi:hypothetical protein
MNLSRRVVRKDVAPLVVCGRHRDPAYTGAPRHVVQHLRHAFIDKVGGERE